MGPQTLQPPAVARASALMHGSNSDFVINAYLALQRQWPDRGGYEHYLFVLEQQPGARASVLREIAGSPTARQCGVRFVDDLPGDHIFLPEHHESHKLVETSLALRMAQAVADIGQLRAAVAQLTERNLGHAMTAIVEANAGAQSMLESRLNALARDLRRVDRRLAGPSPAGDPPYDTGEAIEPVAHAAWRVSVDEQLAHTAGALAELQAQFAELGAGFAQLHHYATVELKRQVADYVNAIAEATRPEAIVVVERPRTAQRRRTGGNHGKATTRSGDATHG